MVEDTAMNILNALDKRDHDKMAATMDEAWAIAFPRNPVAASEFYRTTDQRRREITPPVPLRSER